VILFQTQFSDASYTHRSDLKKLAFALVEELGTNAGVDVGLFM